MWTIRRSNRHIGPDTLAEYMDGRLGAAARTRVDQELASCDGCRAELEELQATVFLLQQLPAEPAPRSFTMPAPPVQPVSPRAFAPLRMPQWVYAGAASAAVVVFTILVSADATGLLEPGTTEVARDSAVGAETESALLDQGAPIEESVQSQPFTAEEEREVAEAGAMAVPEDQESQAPPEAAMALEAAIAAPEAAMAPEAVAAVAAAAAAAAAPPAAQEDGMAAPETATVQGMPTPMPAGKSEPDDEAANTLPPAAESSLQGTPVTDLSSAEPGPVMPPAGETGGVAGGTATVWRVVEGTAAVMGLVFLGGLLLRRRSRRGVRLD